MSEPKMVTSQPTNENQEAAHLTKLSFDYTRTGKECRIEQGGQVVFLSLKEAEQILTGLKDAQKSMTEHLNPSERARMKNKEMDLNCRDFLGISEEENLPEYSAQYISPSFRKLGEGSEEMACCLLTRHRQFLDRGIDRDGKKEDKIREYKLGDVSRLVLDDFYSMHPEAKKLKAFYFLADSHRLIVYGKRIFLISEND